MAEHYMELVWRTGVDGRDLASTYVLRPLTITLSQIFGVMEFKEFTKIFRSTPEETEKMERLEVCTNGCTMVDIQTDPIIHDLFVYVFHGNECIYEMER